MPLNNLFDLCIPYILQYEGGYVFDKTDKGGETNYGISKRAYPLVDIKALTKQGAIDIYRRDYWIKSGSDSLDWPLCLVHFDTAVNMGVIRSKQFLEKSNNVDEYLAVRMQYYKDIITKNPSQIKYLKGWTNRLESLRTVAKRQIIL